MDWAYVLVIILSIFLALFLLLGIILTILLIRVTLQIKAVTESAQQTADDIQGMVSNLSIYSSPGLLVRTMFRHAKNKKKKKE